MTERVLCVDDDPNILQGYQRALRKQFALDVAQGGEEGLEAIARQGPYAVVVADMRMPGINGVEFLARVKQIAPDTVRMMLTGNADQQTALDAVNEGQIFRFLTKPCPPETFAKALEAGLAQYRLVTAERELLSKTLTGAIKLLTDVLGLVNPLAFGRASRLRNLARQLCQVLGVQQPWLIEMAALLSQIGCISVPEEILRKVFQREPLSDAEERIYNSHPETGHSMLVNIPRLETIAEIVAYQEKLYNGGGVPLDHRHGQDIPLGSRILKVALDWDLLCQSGCTQEHAMAEMHSRPGWYDPDVLAALRRVTGVAQTHVICKVRFSDLRDGLVLASDVRSLAGTLLCAKGQEVTPSLRARLRNYLVNVGISSAIEVFVPVDQLHLFQDHQVVSPAEKMRV